MRKNESTPLKLVDQTKTLGFARSVDSQGNRGSLRKIITGVIKTRKFRYKPDDFRPVFGQITMDLIKIKPFKKIKAFFTRRTGNRENLLKSNKFNGLNKFLDELVFGFCAPYPVKISICALTRAPRKNLKGGITNSGRREAP